MISPEEIRHIASLAALDVSDEEVDVLAGQLSRILDHCDQASRPAEGANPPAAQEPHPSRRADVVEPSDPPVDIAGLAPEGTVVDGFFTVPRVVETE